LHWHWLKQYRVDLVSVVVAVVVILHPNTCNNNNKL